MIRTQVITGQEHSQMTRIDVEHHVMEDDFQRSNETGNPVINTSRYGSDENTQESTRNVKDLVKQIILIITQAMVVTF